MQSDKTLLYVQIIFAVTVVGNCYLFKPKPLYLGFRKILILKCLKKKKKLNQYFRFTLKRKLAMHKPVFHCLSELIMCTMRIIVRLWLNAEIISAIVSDTGQIMEEPQQRKSNVCWWEHLLLIHLAFGSWTLKSFLKISSTVTFPLKARLSSSPIGRNTEQL